MTDLVPRRFTGVSRLYGTAAYQRFSDAHIVVVGIGGVGSWAAEALARSAIGKITLIDLDMLAESNINRQIHALEGLFGQAKVDAMQERILQINPDCCVNRIEDFLTPENVATLLDGPINYVIDAIDNTRAKVAMIAHCKSAHIPIICAGAAGGRIDACAVCIDDLARTTQDSLLSRVRQQLRKHHHFPRDPKKKFGVRAVFSQESMRPAQNIECAPASGLSCVGYGSSVAVTASFGFAAAGAVLYEMAQQATENHVST